MANRRRTERPWRRGGEPAAVAPEPEGEKDGEHEGVASELTAGSIWVEGGRRVEIDERSGAPARLAMAASDGERDSAGE